MYLLEQASHSPGAPRTLSFPGFLEERISERRMTAADLVAAISPLLDQVIETHQNGMVAPFAGVEELSVTHARLWYCRSAEKNPSFNRKAVEEILPPNPVVEVSACTRDERPVVLPEESFLCPVFVAGYRTWEQQVGHHDSLSDVFSLGMILASLALRLDFEEPAQLTEFVEHRRNLFELDPDLHPSINKAILAMTEPNRNRRAGDLAAIRDFLVNHGRAVFPAGTEEGKLPAKSRAILDHLRNRLFDTSRRNRLIYFKPGAQSIDLSRASIPELLDFRNIPEEKLATWNPCFAREILGGGKVMLQNYLPGDERAEWERKVDGIRRASNRDEKEFGFSPLRLAIGFLRWSNLDTERGAKPERIHSPLLLLPVKLEVEWGKRNSQSIRWLGAEAEVNPAVRHYLEELHGIRLPETVDLREDPDLGKFFRMMEREIEKGDGNVTLSRVDTPEIRVRIEKAGRRKKRDREVVRIPGRYVRSNGELDYSYDPGFYEPLGLQLFRNRVREIPLAPEGEEWSREVYDVDLGEGWNSYAWFFDLCTVTLGNFHFQKMSLVSDYDQLAERMPENPVFDQLFGRHLPGELPPPPPLELEDQRLIAPSDPSQVSAISRARTGENFIIQGPPGTGKSQTITNLIADYVSRGKRVLFVCEKRAALDVVYSRLAAAGLGRNACIIHDTADDRKPLVDDLKTTFRDLRRERVSSGPGRDLAGQQVATMRRGLEELERFGRGMRQVAPCAELPVIDLLERLVEIDPSQAPPSGDEMAGLPGYADWLAHGELVHELAEILSGLGRAPVFARHPLSSLARAVYSTDQPAPTLRALFDRTVRPVSEVARLAGESAFDLRRTRVAELCAIVRLAGVVRFFVQDRQPELLQWGSDATSLFHRIEAEIRAEERALENFREQNGNWREKFSAFDAEIALERAGKLESDRLRLLRPSFWKLRKLLRQRYDFRSHPFSPRWSAVLENLLREHGQEEVVREKMEDLAREFGTANPYRLRSAMVELERVRGEIFASFLLQSFLDFSSQNLCAESTVQQMVTAGNAPEELHQLEGIVPHWENLTAGQLADLHGRIREGIPELPEFQSTLDRLARTPSKFFDAVRELDREPHEFEAALAAKSLRCAYDLDRSLEGFDGDDYHRICRSVGESRGEWLQENARRVRNVVRDRFLEARETGEFADGELELRHQFELQRPSKTIRELATGETGAVISRLKPVWLMNPLSISTTLPLDPELFDVVIFDEASQIRLEDAIPSLFRGRQVIVVGDEKQLPPTGFFHSDLGSETRVRAREGAEEVEIDLGADSLLSHAARSLPSTMLNWHYRSRREELIGFCNRAFYGGELFTIPDRMARVGERADILAAEAEDAGHFLERTLDQGISHHLLENGVYDKRRNEAEAGYIAALVKALLARETGKSVGIVTFSGAQQTLIEETLDELAREDPAFERRLSQEREREEDGQWQGLFVKNLENVQGDERDIIILSVCYGPGPEGRKMRMNFGPINQPGGEKRLNVILSRAREHMAVVSSFSHFEITNDWNEGASCLKRFLEYAAAVSRGDEEGALRVLTREIGPATGEVRSNPAVVEGIGRALRERGYEVEFQVGQSEFRIDLAVRPRGEREHVLAVLVDGRDRYQPGDEMDRAVLRPGVLRAFGWRVSMVLTKDWHERRDEVLAKLEEEIRRE